jgi:hypothetical protein
MRRHRVAFSRKVVHIRLALDEAGARFRPDKSNCRDGVVERHPKATREANGKFRSQSKAC